MAKTKPERGTPEADVMAGVKTGAVTKSSQTSKTKSKDIARATAAKVEKATEKTKKMLKRGSDSESDSDSDEASNATSDSSESSGSDSEAEAKPKPNGHSKANGKPSKAKDESESESSENDDGSGSSSDESDSDDEAPPVKTGAVKTDNAAVGKANDDGDDDDGSSSDSSAGSTDKKASSGKNGTANVPKSQDKDSDHSSDSSDGSDASDASGGEEEAAPKKRKPEAEADSTPKRARMMDAEPETKGKNLFVGNLPWSVDEAGLGGLFEEFGELSAARLITDRDSGRSKGYGYVEFVNADDAAKALEAMAGQSLEGRNLNVDFAAPRKENPYGNRQQDRARAYGDEVSEPSSTLFVGNISFDADEQMITDAFSEYANLKSVRLPTDMNSGALRGFGYVEFFSIDDATMAFNSMQGAEIAGRRLRLDYAQQRAGNNDSPRGGRGGFGDRGGRGRGGFGDRGGRGGFGDRGGRGGFRGGRGGFGDRGGRGGRGGGRGGSTNRGGMGDFAGKKVTF